MIKGNIVVLIILVSSLVAITNAVQDSIIMGPYKVSFDIGQERGVDYTVDNVTTTIAESPDGYPQMIYRALFKNSTYLVNAEIDILQTDSPYNNSTSVSDLKTLMESGFSGYWTALKWNNRPIDKVPGILVELKDSNGTQDKAYSAAYHLPNENDTSVLIYSSMPLHPETGKLLDTIHVERIEKAT